MADIFFETVVGAGNMMAADAWMTDRYEEKKLDGNLDMTVEEQECKLLNYWIKEMLGT